MAAHGTNSFPAGFLWGAATAGHQIEGNNVASDLWLLENIKPTVFAERSGDAIASFERWPADLELVRDLGLNTYRFSLEWSRIEPEPGCRYLEPGYAYFANSYRVLAAPGCKVARAEHGQSFVAALERGPLLACQFHPELSGAFGHDLIARWLEG